jgi:hypothetical protein
MSLELITYFPTASSTLYALIRRPADAYVWNGTTFVVYAAGDIATYDVPLTEQGGDYYAADFPSTITAGTYSATYYKRAGVAPATTDYIVGGDTIEWNGTTAGLNLTTLGRVKTHMGISGSTYDSLLNNLLSAASRMIEKYTDTGWLASSYTEYYNGTGNGYLCLNNRFVTAMTRVATDPETLIEVQNTSSSVQRAHLSVTSTGLSLTHTASASSTTSTLAFSTYTTVSSLATAIDALGNGWDATTVQGFESFPTADLRVIQHVACSQPDGHTAELEAYVDELPYSRIDEDNGTVWGCFPRGVQNIEVKYVAGYDADEIPDDVQEATCMVVASLYSLASRGSGAGLKREKLGDYEYENFDVSRAGSSLSLTAICPVAALMLSHHKRIPVL